MKKVCALCSLKRIYLISQKRFVISVDFVSVDCNVLCTTPLKLCRCLK